MALSGSGISFGDFQDIEAGEYEKLFGQVKEPLHSNYLELPWDEDAHIQDTVTDTQQDKPYVSVSDENESVQVQQQEQLLQQQQQQQFSLQLQQQQDQHMQQQRHNEQQQTLQIQQQMLSQHHQQQQQQQHHQQMQDHQLLQKLQHEQQQQQQRDHQQHQQHAFSAMCMNPPPTSATFLPSPTQSNTQAPSQAYAHPLQQNHLHMVPPGLNNQMVAEMIAQAQLQAQMAMHAFMPMNSSQTQGQAPDIQAGGQAVPDEVSQISDGQTIDMTDAEAGKKRRNKKRRDPSFYANFYTSDPNQYGRTETAYYADNESSGSSGASSEVTGGGSGGMELEHKMDYTSQEVRKMSQYGNEFTESKVQKEAPSANETTDFCSHHAPERTSPVAKEEQQISNDLSTMQMPNNSSPSQVQYKPTTATESSAIQAQAVPSKSKQNVMEYPRTKVSTIDENVNPYGLSFGVDPNLPGDLQQDEAQTLSVDSCVVTEAQQEESDVRDSGLQDDSVVNYTQQPTPQEDKPDVGVAAITPTPTEQNETPQPEEGAQTPSTTTQAALPPPPKPTSWASLFKPSGSVAAAPTPTMTAPVLVEPPQTETKVAPQSDTDDKTPVSVDRDSRAKELGGVLSRVVLNHRVMNVQPRGLKNIGNWCYVNSILQALLACPPFYNLMKHVPFFPMHRGPSSSPMLDSMVELVSKFSEQSNRIVPKKGTQDVKAGIPFEPSVVYKMMTVAQTSLSVKQGRQEDAEEFLGCLLNGLHEEMLGLMKFYAPGKYEDTSVQGTAKTNGLSENHTKTEEDEEEDEADEWEQVGPRNKSSITRVAHFNRSPLYDIFGGQMRSALHQQGSKESATLQKFFTLQLDIQSEKVWTVRDAIDNLGNKEALHGFTCNKTKQEVEASRRISLEELPPVLTLHLKRFVYDKSGGCQKLMKKLDYGVELEINRELLSPNIKSKVYIAQRTYKLFAVVYHTGKEASGGHYITDVFHAGSNSWLRLDDGIVKPIRIMHVIKPLPAYTPYLLFYRRRDLI